MSKQYSTLPIPHRRILFFDWSKPKDNTGPDWLQITSVDNIGAIDTDVRQKIIRISEADQVTLLYMLQEKFPDITKRQ